VYKQQGVALGYDEFGLWPKQLEETRVWGLPLVDPSHPPILGNPDTDKICTSHCERMNGSIRNFVKRMGRLIYCFSKRWDNHRAALALFFAHYNYCRKHKNLKGQTPAMAHGLTVEVWSIRELLERMCGA